ncbi:uncharacterized protein [Erythrolamprus reginae]|uniref:uncharacterized protein n=1 Tax=Erythrolamprus reginae TaxID=121349 RepID=UPI00396C46F3
MEPSRNHRGSQAAILLAGCILSCLLQLVPAQENLTVGALPQLPSEGESVLLNLENVRAGFERCVWTLPSGGQVIFPDSQITPTVDPKMVELHRNCSLSIKRLQSSNKGRYTIQVTYPASKQPGAKGPEILFGSINLTFCDVKQIRININPQNPKVGQNAVLTPNGMPTNAFCQWKQRTLSGKEIVFEHSEQESKKQQNPKQFVKPDCSLQLNQLTQDNSGDYSFHAEVLSDQNSARGNREQSKCYRSQTVLKVAKSGSASVKYSAGIIAVALLGSLTWTSSLSFMPLLFGMLSPSFAK